jgi:SM-20-related protein
MNQGATRTVTSIIDALADNGCYVGASIFSDALTHALSSRLQSLIAQGALHAARIGRASGARHETAIRSDSALWLDDAPADAHEAEALGAINELRAELNRDLFLGATHAELHYAHYAAGASYAVHRDRFDDSDARLVSLILYLNHSWADGQGGELMIYDEAMNPLHRVLPRAGTMVAFLSGRFPHEVLPATQARLSLTGWLRRGTR